ncbi:Rv3654c family TadE-like protein [Mycobacterium vicinigordonae]|uniref:Rv3654c family TadE-like protein n=1 Tax=Mycobacterium vicinigordonae TaxID=1719132 RepID=UPI0031B604E2
MFVVAVLVCVTAAGVCLGSVVVARHRAQAAADLAALAAAAQLPQGVSAACVRATTVARQMRVADVECRLDGLDMIVTVEVPIVRIGSARASARAGPVTAIALAR